MNESAIEQFRSALIRRGIIPPEDIITDGRMHRCDTDGGKRGRLDASYLLHMDNLPAGGFENHRDGLGWENWRIKSVKILSAAELDEQRQRFESACQAREVNLRIRYENAAAKAVCLWGKANPAMSSNPYLIKKGVGAYGLRSLRNCLLIPVRDIDGVLWSLQFIGPNGDKRFLTGSRKRGCYFAIGRIRDVLCITEGYATAASVFESTGYATAVAFDAGNLEPVAQALRHKYPVVRLIICADNDLGTIGNPGVSNAMAAARAVGGHVAIPSFEEVAGCLRQPI